MFREWMRDCLVNKQAWKLPNAEGGYISGTLMNEIAQCHREKGIAFKGFYDFNMSLVDKAIRHRVSYYFDLFESIKNRGFVTSDSSHIYCHTSPDGLLYIKEGHHRASALWVLGYEEILVEVFKPNSLRKKYLAPLLSAFVKITEHIRHINHNNIKNRE